MAANCRKLSNFDTAWERVLQENKIYIFRSTKVIDIYRYIWFSMLKQATRVISISPINKSVFAQFYPNTHFRNFFSEFARYFSIFEKYYLQISATKNLPLEAVLLSFKANGPSHRVQHPILSKFHLKKRRKTQKMYRKSSNNINN